MSIDLGAIIYVALKPVFKIYVILFIGYLLARFNVIDVESSRAISNMVVNAILPCLVFNKIVGNISAKDIKEIGVIILTALLLFSIGSVCAIVVKFTLPVPKRWTWGLFFAGLFPNISDLPIAYVQSMGTGIIFNTSDVDKGVAYCCIFLTTQSFMMMNFGMFRLVGIDFRDATEDEENTSFTASASIKTEKGNHDGNDKKATTKKMNHPASEKMNSNRNGQQDNLKDDLHMQNEIADIHSLSESDLASTDQLEIHRPRVFKESTDMTTTRSSASCSSKLEPETNALFRSRTVSTLHSDMGPKMNRTMSLTNSYNHNNAKARNRRRSQTIDDVIDEYSVANRMKSGEIDLSKPLTLTADIGEMNTALIASGDSEDNESQEETENDNTSFKIVRTATNKSLRKVGNWFEVHNLIWLEYILINFFRPASLGALLGIVCAMIPWVKALFVPTYVHVHKAPDGLPVLNFIMDFSQYIGNACIPLGLILLGGTIARLQVKSIPKGFLKVALTMSVIRLAILPIIGVAWADKIYDMNWVESDIAKFVIILTFSMPSATAQIYFTAFFTLPEGEHIQMDCLSVLFLVQYILLFITLPFVISYTLKVNLHY